jgi:hypothetical protein
MNDEEAKNEKPAPANAELQELAERINAGGDGGDGSPASGGGAGGAGGAGGGAAGGADTDADKQRQIYGLTRGLVEGVCKAVASRWPAAVYSDAEKHMMASLLVPVALKHANSWFLKYEAEFCALGFVGYMGFTGYQRVRAAAAAGASSERPAPGAAERDSKLNV